MLCVTSLLLRVPQLSLVSVVFWVSVLTAISSTWQKSATGSRGHQYLHLCFGFSFSILALLFLTDPDVTAAQRGGKGLSWFAVGQELWPGSVPFLGTRRVKWKEQVMNCLIFLQCEAAGSCGTIIAEHHSQIYWLSHMNKQSWEQWAQHGDDAVVLQKRTGGYCAWQVELKSTMSSCCEKN